MKRWRKMRFRAIFILMIVIAALCSACGPSEEELNATAAQASANSYGTQDGRGARANLHTDDNAHCVTDYDTDANADAFSNQQPVADRHAYRNAIPNPHSSSGPD